MAKRISCKRCQYRKLKCSRTEPCESCSEAGKICEYRDVDRKRKPVSAKYVTELENRIALLESFIAQVKSSPPEERDNLLRDSDLLDDHFLPGHLGFKHLTDSSRNDRLFLPDNLEQRPEGFLTYHGPTSIFHTQFSKQPSHESPNSVIRPSFSGPICPNFEQIAAHFGISLDNELVIDALTYFFKWQYPLGMFVYREAFLRDHFGDRQNCKYWSSALLMSICALGLLMSPDGDQQRASEKFFSAAETMLIVFGFTQPSIASVQAFLCLAFYEIGRGNLSKGWGFSGVAFRMAQDLGFQRDPEYWASYDISITTQEDVEIRRRIFWGCYTSDKLISLILGRTALLSYHDAEVEMLARLPDFPEMEQWLPIGFNSMIGDFGETKPLVPCFLQQIELSRILERALASASSLLANRHSNTYQIHLDNLNLELSRWQSSLPACAQWNKWVPASSPLVPSVATLHLMFHSARIAFNVSTATSLDHGNSQRISQEHCAASAQDIISLVRRYRSQYGLRFAPFIFVYGLAQAARCMSILGTFEETSYLARLLDDCSPTWAIGRELQKL